MANITVWPSMLLSRRKFVQSLLAFAASGAVPSAFAATLEAQIPSPLSQLLVVGSANNLCVIDLKTGAFRHKLALKFIPHAFIPTPYNPDKIWAIQRFPASVTYAKKVVRYEKTLFRAVEFDLRSGRTTNEIQANLGCEYRGHGFFAPDGKTLFITRVDMENAEGFLTGYDTSSHESKIVANFSLGKTGLHECRLGANKQTAHVATTGAVKLTPYAEKSTYKRFSRGGIATVDLGTGKVVSRIDIMDDTYLIGHFHYLKNGHIIATCNTKETPKRNAAIFWGHVDNGTLTAIELPEGKKNAGSEKFDIAVDEKRQVAAVNDNILKEIYLIDTQSGTCKESIPYDTFGVTYDHYRDAFLVSGQQITMLDAQLKGLSATPDYSTLQGPFRSGHSLII